MHARKAGEAGERSAGGEQVVHDLAGTCGITGRDQHVPHLWSYTTVPNRAPTPAVSPMARAPQNVTRSAPTQVLAPPASAASPPSTARNTSELAATPRDR